MRVQQCVRFARYARSLSIIYAYGLTTIPCPRYMLRAQCGQLINIILRSPFNILHSVLVGERSKPLSDKLGGEICIALVCIYLYYIPPTLSVHFSMTRSVRYQPILHTLYYMLHTEHAYCLSYRFLNSVVKLPSLKWLKWLKYSTEDLVSFQLSE